VEENLATHRTNTIIKVQLMPQSKLAGVTFLLGISSALLGEEQGGGGEGEREGGGEKQPS